MHRPSLNARHAGHELSLRARCQGSILLLLPLLILLSACAKFKELKHEHVYVSARQVYLHDRVAAVSNRTAMVTNGEALEVVERGKRFVKVRTAKGEVGWIEDHAFIDDKLYAQYQDLTKTHANDPAITTAQLRDDLYLHLLPGRETPHFLLIPGNARVQLLQRGTIEKAPPPGILTTQKPRPAAPVESKPASPGTKPSTAAKPVAPPPALPLPTAPHPAAPMEDWWLVRDKDGHTGWLLAGRLDIDIPDEVGAYAEGQRMVGAYPIATVTDYGGGAASRSGKESERHGKKGQSDSHPTKPVTDLAPQATPDAPRKLTEYVTVLSPPRSGLPFDFDQIRVFTWSLNHHRYETAFRLHGVEGYLPVKISQETVNGEQQPVFSFAIASGPNVTVDPDTGVTHPVNPRTISYRLEGNMVKRTGADQAPIVLLHSSQEPGAPKPAKKKKH
jgi:hypothetical protein